jgi:hypothetical protein
VGIREASSIRVVRRKIKPLPSEPGKSPAPERLRIDVSKLGWDSFHHVMTSRDLGRAKFPVTVSPAFQRKIFTNATVVLESYYGPEHMPVDIYHADDREARYRISGDGNAVSITAEYKQITLGMRIQRNMFELYALPPEKGWELSNEIERFQKFLRVLLEDPIRFNDIPF